MTNSEVLVVEALDVGDVFHFILTSWKNLCDCYSWVQKLLFTSAKINFKSHEFERTVYLKLNKLHHHFMNFAVNLGNYYKILLFENSICSEIFKSIQYFGTQCSNNQWCCGYLKLWIISVPNFFLFIVSIVVFGEEKTVLIAYDLLGFGWFLWDFQVLIASQIFGEDFLLSMFHAVFLVPSHKIFGCPWRKASFKHILHVHWENDNPGSIEISRKIGRKREMFPSENK